MFTDRFITRIALRAGIFALDAIPFLAAVWSLSAVLLHPVPPAIILFGSLPLERLDELFAYDWYFGVLTSWAALETIWWIVHSVGRGLVARGWWDLRSPKEEMGSEERWRLWVKMCESAEDPFDWLGGFFLLPGAKRAPRGAIDPNVTRVQLKDIGRTNVEEYIAHFMFGRKLRSITVKSTEKAELHSMVLLLEAAFQRTRPGFKFPLGRSRHRVFLVNDEPLRTSHHPLLFYSAIWLCSGLGNTALYLAGFRYYGPRSSWPFPLLIFRGSRRALERLQDSAESTRMGERKLADRVGYWYWPGSKAAQEESKTPIIFLHGISGTYGPTPFILLLCRATGRPCFVPELPYVSMRLSPPSAIRTRVELVASARRMLWRHGFGVTFEENDDEDEEWRRGRAVVVGHSLGAGPVGWLLRDAPDIVAGTVLIDPMSLLLFAADAPRNFFRTKCRTAGEIFFRYFSMERGIHHFMARHMRWSDSVLFGPAPAAPLPPSVLNSLVPRMARTPLDPPFDKPNYAQYVSPSPSGPFPTRIFLSQDDCILPIPKITAYLLRSSFTDDALRIMPGEHASCLISPYWAGEVAKAVDEVADAGEKLLWED